MKICENYVQKQVSKQGYPHFWTEKGVFLPVNGYKKVNKGCMGNRELSRLFQTATESNGWVRKSLCNRL